MRLRCLMAIVGVAVAMPIITWAHPGGLNSEGCHNDRKNGGYHCHRGPSAGTARAAKGSPASAPKRPTVASPGGEKQAGMVSFNTSSHKYHDPACIWATRCTRNCVQIPKAEAIKQGGIACQTCGGGG